MKKLSFTIGLLLAALFAQAQNVCGSWRGAMTLGDRQILVVFNVTKLGDVYSATMDSPSQNVKGISTTSTTFVDSILTINMDGAKIQYQGRLMKSNKLNGIFTQMGKRYALSLTNRSAVSKSSFETKSVKRISKAYSYSIDTVFIGNNGSKNVNTVVYQPYNKGKAAAVVLVCDLDISNSTKYQKKFSDLSDFLCTNGFIVLCVESANENTTTMASDYLKTYPGVNAKKISVVKFNDSSMTGKCLSTKKSTLLCKEISMVNTEKLQAYNELTNWLFKIS